MKRRALLVMTLAALAAPHAALAQRTLPRVGILEPYSATDPGYRVHEALGDEGLVEGRDLLIDWRFGEDRLDRLPALAAELVRPRPDAIVAIGDPAIRSVREAAPTIPIVAATDDLVGEGHAESLAHPGGMVTGLSILASELNTKRLELLKETVPRAGRISVLWDPNTGRFHLPALEATARTLDIALQILEVRDREMLERAIDAAVAGGADAINVLASPLLHGLRQAIIDRLAMTRIPAIFQWGDTARQGGFMAYGPGRAAAYRTTVQQLARVLAGARPADIPVAQPTEFELVINLRTARALGLAIPPAIFARASEVIE